ncbi:MAG: hypothetical protein ACW9W4_00480 [Candidatus Nitrosopumilus sp. bin_7KS]
MIELKGDLLGECGDCGEHITYSKKSFESHAVYLKKHRCPQCGNFALKARV